MPHGSRSFEIEFDFIEHSLDIRTDDGLLKRIALRPRSVADFYADVLKTLDTMGLPVTITELPSEIPDAILFSQDRTHVAYDAEYANRFWRVLSQVDRVFKLFRTGFLGKSSPAHFFWGSFDLAITRFSGRKAPPFTGKAPGLAAEVMKEAYSHEVSSAGFGPAAAASTIPPFIRTRIRCRRPSRTSSCGLPKPFSARSSASLSCRTTWCAQQMIRTRHCSRSSKALTTPQRFQADGIERHSSVRAVRPGLRGRCRRGGIPTPRRAALLPVILPRPRHEIRVDRIRVRIAHDVGEALHSLVERTPFSTMSLNSRCASGLMKRRSGIAFVPTASRP